MDSFTTQRLIKALGRILSGIFRAQIENIPLVNGYRAGICHISLPFYEDEDDDDDDDDDGDDQPHKVFIHELL